MELSCDSKISIISESFTPASEFCTQILKRYGRCRKCREIESYPMAVKHSVAVKPESSHTAFIYLEKTPITIDALAKVN